MKRAVAAGSALAWAPVGCLALAPDLPWLAVPSGLLLALLACCGAGRLALAVLPPPPSAFARFVLALLLGYGLMGTSLSLLGAIGLLVRPTILVVLGAAATAALPLLLELLPESRRAWRFWPLSVWVALGLLGLEALAGVALSLRPPRTLGALEGPAALARQWGASGEVQVWIGHHGSFAPSLSLVWRATGEALGGHPLEAAIGLLALLLVAAGTALAVRGVLGGGWAAALLAATFCLATPLLHLSLAERASGLAAGGLALGALFALWMTADPEEAGYRRAWTALAGLLLGFALACGWQAWPLLAALLLVGLLRRPREDGSAEILGRLCLLCFVAAIAVGPWLARNALVTGNPFYPHLFGGPGWDETAAAALRAARPAWPGPFAALVGRPGEAAVFGPLVLLLLPLAALAPIVEPRSIGIAGAGGMLAAAWSLTAPRPGDLAALSAVICVLAALGAARIRRHVPALGKTLLALLLAGVAMQAWPLLRALDPGGEGLLAGEAEILELRRPELASLREAGAAADEAARILLVGETRAWALDRPAVWGARSDPAPVSLLLEEARRASSGDEALAFRAALRRVGITHLLISPGGALRLDRPPWDHFREARDGGWRVAFRYLLDPQPIWTDARSGAILWDLRAGASLEEEFTGAAP